MSGIHTIDDLRARCWVDEQTGCWHWRLSTNGEGLPSLWLPALRARVSLGTAICVLITGAKPARGVFWHCTCQTRACANPEHRTAGTRSSQMRSLGMTRDPLQRARIALGKQAKSRITAEQFARILSATGPQIEIAAAEGISRSHVSRIRRGERRNLASVEGMSVFNWRPTP